MSKSHWLKDEEQKGNFSNDKQDTFDPAKGYTGIRLQKGVPLLDRDWNELEDIRRYAEVMLRKHYIGNGVPDENSFKIETSDPPANDFRIHGGRCLVDGLEVENGVDFILYSQQEGVEPEPFHHYYNIARIHRKAGKSTIETTDIEDLRSTGLVLHRLKKTLVDDNMVTRARITDGAVNTVKLADRAVTNSKLNDGSVNEDKISASVNAKLVTDGDNHTHSAEDVGALPITGGTVNGDIVASGKITSQNSRVFATANNFIEPKYLSIGDNSWKDMPDMSIEITTGKNSLLVLFNVGGVKILAPQDNSYSDFRLLIDGQQKCYKRFGRAIEHGHMGVEIPIPINVDVSFSWMGPISAGQHNIKVQWRLNNLLGANLTCSNNNSTRSLMAIEL